MPGIKSINSNQIIVCLLSLLAFSIPFGMWQDQVLQGMTMAKIIIPIASLIFIFSLLPKENRQFIFYWPWLAYGLFIILTMPTLLAGGAAGQSHLILFTGYGALMFLSRQAIRESKDILLILKAYTIGLATTVLFVILAYLHLFDIGTYFGHPMIKDVFGLNRLLGTEANPNAYAAFFIIGLPVTLALFIHDQKISLKILWFTLTVLFLLALSLTASRSAALGAFTAIAIFLYLKSDMRMIKTVIFLCCLPLCLIAALKMPDFIVEHASYAKASEFDYSYEEDGMVYEKQALLLRDKNRSVKYRLEFIPVAWDIFKNHPWQGIAYNDLKAHLAPYNTKQDGPHNILFHTAIFFGAPALLVFCLFLGWVLLGGFHEIIKEEKQGHKTIQALCFAVVTGLLINGMFHSSHFNALFWLAVALLISAASLKKEPFIISLKSKNVFNRKSIN